MERVRRAELSTVGERHALTTSVSFQVVSARRPLRESPAASECSNAHGSSFPRCSLAIQLAKHRESVLLMSALLPPPLSSAPSTEASPPPPPGPSSTDPAHNLSDAFSQKFGKEATPVTGFTNLSAMEIDPNSSMQDLMEQGGDNDSGMGSMMQDLAYAIPGIDEAMGFAEVLR